MSLDLPVDIYHRAIGAVVRNQNIDLRRPILLFVSARNAAPDTVSTISQDGIIGEYAHAQAGPFGSQYGVPD